MYSDHDSLVINVEEMKSKGIPRNKKLVAECLDQKKKQDKSYIMKSS